MTDRGKKTETGSAALQDAMSLGEYLAEVRRIKKLSLREVEEATKQEVSNAYLSQLENGHIKKPSPNVLFSLSSVYAVPYELLMEKAGYIAQTTDQQFQSQSGTTATFCGESLSRDEEEALLEYLAFIRTRKNQR